MTEGKVLYAVLSGNSGVTALVNARIYPESAPQQAALPYIVYSQEIVPVDSKDGHAGTDMVHYSIAAWAETADASSTVAAAVKAATHFYQGTAATKTVSMTVQKTETGRADAAEFFFTQVLVKARIS